MEELQISALYKEEGKSLAYPYLKEFLYPWEAIGAIKRIISEIAKSLPRDVFDEISPDVFVAKSARIAPTAYIGAPAIICEDAEVRHGAFIRGSAIVGRGAVVGNSTELKNCILFDGVQVPHFNYVGDSILGYKAHMGAGARTIIWYFWGEFFMMLRAFSAMPPSYPWRTIWSLLIGAAIS